VEQEEDFLYPETAPKLKDVTEKMERTVKWTAKAALGIAIVGVYQGARYKKLRDGDEDEEIPEDEFADDLPDVDWVKGKRENENS
jgi:queuine/archaeosine tRNA-ribosyltransferase